MKEEWTVAKKQNESKPNPRVSSQPPLHQRAREIQSDGPSIMRYRWIWKSRCVCR
jgi:hypothetical protein